MNKGTINVKLCSADDNNGMRLRLSILPNRGDTFVLTNEKSSVRYRVTGIEHRPYIVRGESYHDIMLILERTF